jgi:hypothetical protein
MDEIDAPRRLDVFLAPDSDLGAGQLVLRAPSSSSAASRIDADDEHSLTIVEVPDVGGLRAEFLDERIWCRRQPPRQGGERRDGADRQRSGVLGTVRAL